MTRRRELPYWHATPMASEPPDRAEHDMFAVAIGIAALLFCALWSGGLS